MAFLTILGTVGILALLVGHLIGGGDASLAVVATLLVEEWNEELTQKIRDANPHLRRAVNHDRFVTSDGKKVHLPYENQDPGIEINRSQFPAQVTQLDDGDLEYNLDWLSTDPTHIKNKYLDEISYDYLASIRRRHNEVAAQEVGHRSIWQWAPAGGRSDRIVRTSGGATTAKPDGAAGGDRKLATIQDLRQVRKLFHKMGLAGANLVIQCEPEIYQQLADQKEVQDVNLGGSQMVNREGVIDRFAGFDFLEPMSEKVPIYDNQSPANKRPRGASAQTDDNLAAIIWAEESVTQAMGTMEVNVDERPADYFGVIISVDGWHKGYYRRPEQLGRVALVQDHV